MRLTKRMALAGLLALPVLWGGVLVGLFGVNQVYWDEWRMIEELKVFRDSGVSLAALYSQHNEHRIFLPRIVLMATGAKSGYNTILHMCLGQLLVLVAYACQIRFVLRLSQNDSRRRWTAGVLLLAGFSCYNTMQYENFLWGFQVGFLMVLAFASLAFYHMDLAVGEGRPGHLVLALLAGIGASLSSLHGLFVWPVFGAQWILARLSKAPFPGPYSLSVLAVAVASCAAYFMGYQKPGYHPDYLEGGLGRAVAYFFATVGSTGAARFAVWAVVTGALIFAASLVLCLHLVRTRRVRAYLFPIGLVLFGYAVAASLAIGRAGLKAGVAGAMTSRYSTYSILVFAGILLIVHGEYLLRAPAFAAGQGWGRKYCLAVVALLACFVMIKNVVYLHPARKWREERKAGIAITRNYRSATWEQLQKVGPFANRAHAVESIGILEEFGWGPFSKSLATAQAPEP